MALDVSRWLVGGYAYRNLGQGWGEGLLGLGFLRKPPRFDGRSGKGDDHYSAVLVLSGHGRYTAHGRSWDLSPGSVFQRFAHDPHQLDIQSGEPWHECWVACGGPIADSLRAYGLVDPARPVLTVPIDRAWLTDLARCRDRLRAATAVELPRMVPVTLDLLVRLLIADRASEHDLVSQACARLTNDPRCDLHTLAHDSGLSYERFRKVFTQATGESPGSYRIRQRIDRARALLLDPGATVAGVAEALGYPSPFSFSSQFHSVVGCAPTAWRLHRGTT